MRSVRTLAALRAGQVPKPCPLETPKFAHDASPRSVQEDDSNQLVNKALSHKHYGYDGLCSCYVSTNASHQIMGTGTPTPQPHPTGLKVALMAEASWEETLAVVPRAAG
jgi:hypothetical protein